MNTFSFSPDGQRLVSAGVDRTLRVWDLRRGTSDVLDRHVMDVTSAIFSADGSQVLSASNDGTVRLWDLSGKEAPVVHETREGAVLDAVFSRDGRRIATTGVDGTVRIAACEVCGKFDDILAAARSRPPRKLTTEEERRYAALAP